MNGFWIRLARPALAFLAASIVGALIITLSFYVTSVFGDGAEPVTAEGLAAMLTVTVLTGAYVAVFAAIPATLLIWLFRLLNAPRGWTDGIAGGLLGALLIHIMAFGLSGLTTVPSALSLLFGFAGLCAGLTYWFATGRPAPPRSGS